MSVGNTFIELKGIVKLFPGVRALGGVSFDIREGEVHSLCGENGAGKSTLIKVMTGAHQRDEGQYLIDGKEVNFRSTQEAIAMGVSCVYQELSIAPQLDVAHNLFIGNLPMKGGLVDHKKLYAETDRILKELDMPISPKTIAGDLSVGQQQMIEIGRALTRNARLIIMDEPTSALDYGNTVRVLSTVRQLAREGMSIVQSTHQPDQAFLYADQTLVINDGRVHAFGNPKDVITKELVSTIYDVDVEVNSLYGDKVRVCVPVREIER